VLHHFSLETKLFENAIIFSFVAPIKVNICYTPRICYALVMVTLFPQGAFRPINMDMPMKTIINIFANEMLCLYFIEIISRNEAFECYMQNAAFSTMFLITISSG